MKLSGVPEKAYNSRPSEFGGFLLCVRPCHPYIGASVSCQNGSHAHMRIGVAQARAAVARPRQ